MAGITGDCVRIPPCHSTDPGLSVRCVSERLSQPRCPQVLMTSSGLQPMETHLPHFLKALLV